MVLSVYFDVREQLPIPTLKRLIWTLLKVPASPYLNTTTNSSGLMLFYHRFSLEPRELEAGTFRFLVNWKKKRLKKRSRRERRRRREMCGTSCMLSGIQVQGAEQAEWWGTGSLTEPTRLSRHQARQARKTNLLQICPSVAVFVYICLCFSFSSPLHWWLLLSNVI